MKNCPICKRTLKERIKERRLCTQYTDDSKNYVTSCFSCFEERNRVYKEMWDEYKNSQGCDYHSSATENKCLFQGTFSDLSCLMQCRRMKLTEDRFENISDREFEQLCMEKLPYYYYGMWLAKIKQKLDDEEQRGQSFDTRSDQPRNSERAGTKTLLHW